MQPSFFRVFDLLLSATNPGWKRTRWSHDGVDFEYERHSFTGSKHGLTIEIFTLTRPGRRGWSFMVTKEYWWAGPESKALKTLRWARALSGQRADLLNWMRAQEAAFARSFTAKRAAVVDEKDMGTTRGHDAGFVTLGEGKGRRP